MTLLGVAGVLVPLAGALWVARRLLGDRSRFPLAKLFQVYAILVVLYANAYALLQLSSHGHALRGDVMVWTAASRTQPIADLGGLFAVFGDAIYFSVVTITTLGYGDIVPAAGLVRVLAASEALGGIAFVGIVLGHYFSVCSRCE